MEEKIRRIRELIRIINEAGKAYYQEDREIMSNYEYDALYDELAALEKETGSACRKPHSERGLRGTQRAAEGSP